MVTETFFLSRSGDATMAVLGGTESSRVGVIVCGVLAVAVGGFAAVAFSYAAFAASPENDSELAGIAIVMGLVVGGIAALFALCFAVAAIWIWRTRS